MTPARLREAEHNQTITARKVLDAVPKQEFWTHGQVFGEVKRLGYNIDMRTVGGCLNSLIQAGLVRETKEGFMRITARVPRPASPTPVPVTYKGPTIVPSAPQPPVIRTTIDEELPILPRMARLAQSLRAVAQEIDDLALDITDELEEAQRSSAAMKQLKTLLGGGS